ncbi:MAG: eight-cysteine-cluster domain-containing protein, partial [Candidatus Bilamarchaeaceae archaeon]
FFAAILQPMPYNEYEYSFDEVSSTGYNNSVFMSSKPGSSYVRREDAVFARELFLSPGSQILCFGNVNRDVCSEIPINSSFNPYAHTLASLLFTTESIQANYQMNKKFVEFGALSMKPETQEKEYLGRKCTEIYYTLDYTKMTVEQIISLGIDPASAEVLSSKEYNFSVCIDPETKELIYKRMDYSSQGELFYSEYFITMARWGASSMPPAPSILSDEHNLKAFFNTAKMSQQRFAECLTSNESDSCLRAEAISTANEKICAYIKDADVQDSCYVNIGLAKKDISFCSRISPQFLDDCYLEFAWRFMNASYCDMMASAEKKDECYSVLGEEAAKPSGEASAGQEQGVSEYAAGQNKTSQPAPAVECSVDSDCVRAGCSSQLCVPSASAGIVTTCEYKSEYDCLPLSHCGCNEGRCGWAQTPEYLNCLGSKKTK